MALSMIRDDPAKILPLRFGTSEEIHPGKRIPKAGRCSLRLVSNAIYLADISLSSGAERPNDILASGRENVLGDWVGYRCAIPFFGG